MHDGAESLEYAWHGTEWKLRLPGGGSNREVKKIGERGINALRKYAFITRDGELPPGPLTRRYLFGWVVTPAGEA